MKMLTTGPYRLQGREADLHSEGIDVEPRWHRKIFALLGSSAPERILVSAVLLTSIFLVLINVYVFILIFAHQSLQQGSISRCTHQSCTERTVEVDGDRCSCAHKLTGVRFTFEPEEEEE